MPKEGPAARALLATIVARAFSELDVCVTLRAENEWHSISMSDTVIPFERDFGRYPERPLYNELCMERVARERRTVLGEHAGFSDLFVPVGDGATGGLLVAGPFATRRASSADLVERWRWLGGGEAHLGDRRFAEYLAKTFATLTLEGSLQGDFKRLLECFAELLGGTGRLEKIGEEASRLRGRLLGARSSELTWNTVASLVDPISASSWRERGRVDELEAIGLPWPPEHALVGLLFPGREVRDAVDEVVKRDAFQRESVTLARKHSAAAGKVGDHGLSLVVRASGGASRKRAHLIELAERLRTLARRHGFKLHVGVGPLARGSLPDHYQAALAVAERAATRGLSLLHADADTNTPMPLRSLAKLRRELGREIEVEPNRVASLFEKYLTSVVQTSGHRLEATRVELDAGLERAVEALIRFGTLDESFLERLQFELGRSVSGAATLSALLILYRSAVADLELTLAEPKRAGKERSRRRAIAFVREHLGGPLSLAQVARAAGFAPAYFSKLFKQQEGMNLEDYIRKLRVERARDLLRNTTLSVEQVGKLSGLGKRSFHRVFRSSEGMTPRAYRERYWWSGASAHDAGKPQHLPPKRTRPRRPSALTSGTRKS